MPTLIEEQLYRNLCICIADLPGGLMDPFFGTVTASSFAHFCLVWEQCMRLRRGRIDYEHSGEHPAFRTLAAMGESASPGSLAEVPAGPGAAKYFSFNKNGIRGGGPPREPDTTQIVAPEFFASTFGPFLVTTAKAAIGEEKFNAERRWLRLPAGSGFAFPPTPIIDRPDSPEIFLDPGTWRVQFEGHVRNWDDGEGTMEVSIALDGTPVETYTAEREITGDDAARVYWATFSTDDSIVVGSTAALTLKNTSATAEMVSGILRYWQE